MEKQLKINFILPYKPKRPTGGFKVMYEYANRLVKKGYDIHLYYPIKTPLMHYRLPLVARQILAKVEGFKKYQWFCFDPSIRMSYISEVKDGTIRDADIAIATWWSTATEMGKLNASKGHKINLIQGFENWEGNEDLLFKSYAMPDVTNVVVASYLKNIVQQHTSKEAILITNSIDTTVYNITRAIDQRNDASICMLYSEQEIKGSKYGLDALHIVKAKHPDLVVDLFSIHSKPENLPEWIRFHYDHPKLAEVFNQNAIFVSNSLTEGMALTPLEAMFCGCAVICTDIDGHNEYAFEGETCLLVETKNVEVLAEKINYLIEENKERIELAHRGNIFVQRFSWDLAIWKMNDLILKLIAN